MFIGSVRFDGLLIGIALVLSTLVGFSVAKVPTMTVIGMKTFELPTKLLELNVKFGVVAENETRKVALTIGGCKMSLEIELDQSKNSKAKIAVNDKTTTDPRVSRVDVDARPTGLKIKDQQAACPVQFFDVDGKKHITLLLDGHLPDKFKITIYNGDLVKKKRHATSGVMSRDLRFFDLILLVGVLVHIC